MALDALPAAQERTAARLGRRLRGFAMLALARLLRWHEVARQRRALLRLDDRMLKDVGVTRAEAEREASRPFWDDTLDLWLNGRY